jgi:hypothetical protein
MLAAQVTAVGEDEAADERRCFSEKMALEDKAQPERTGLEDHAEIKRLHRKKSPFMSARMAAEKFPVKPFARRNISGTFRPP